MTYKLPPGETLDGANELSESTWEDEGPDSIHDVLAQLGTGDPAAVRKLMTQPQWNDFSLALRQDVTAWLADHGA